MRIEQVGSCDVSPVLASQFRNGDHWHCIWPDGNHWCYPTAEEAAERAVEVTAVRSRIEGWNALSDEIHTSLARRLVDEQHLKDKPMTDLTPDTRTALIEAFHAWECVGRPGSAPCACEEFAADFAPLIADLMADEAKRRSEGDVRERGLEPRYEVRQIDDPTGKHNECRYFVLDPQHDPIARRALLEYSRDAHDAGYEALSNDLMTWLGQIRDAECGRSSCWRGDGHAGDCDPGAS